MQAVLKNINTVPGVMGSMVCDDEGALAAHVFPPLFDLSMLQEAASTLADSSIGLQSATGDMELLDLRFNDARIVVKPMTNSFLLLLCTKGVNLQLLVISLNVAIKKIEKLFTARDAQANPLEPVLSP